MTWPIEQIPGPGLEITRLVSNRIQKSTKLWARPHLQNINRNTSSTTTYIHITFALECKIQIDYIIAQEETSNARYDEMVQTDPKNLLPSLQDTHRASP